MEALEKNGTWEMGPLPVGKKLVGNHWVFTIKYHSNGSIVRYKARLVARGYTQSYDIDYNETFPPVAKLNTIRVLIAFAAMFDYNFFSVRCKACFSAWRIRRGGIYVTSPKILLEKKIQGMCITLGSLYMDSSNPIEPSLGNF